MKFISRPKIVVNTTDPITLSKGEMWINSTDSRLKYFDGTSKYELIPSAELISTSNGEGASLVGIEDLGSLYTAVDVEQALQEIASRVGSIESSINWEEQVLSVETDPTLLTPSIGDRFIVGVGATGDWAGQDGNIAEWDGSAWIYTTLVLPADEGTAVFVQAEDKAYVLNGSGSWVPFGSLSSHDALQSISGGNGSDEYYHLTLADYTLVQDIDDTAAGKGANLVATEVTEFTRILNGQATVQDALLKLDLLGSTTPGEGSSEIAVDPTNISASGLLTGQSNAQSAFDKIDQLGTTVIGEGASLTGISDVGTYFTGTDVEAALQELGSDVSILSNSSATIYKTSVTATAGTPVAITHNLNTEQIMGSTQLDNGGSPGEIVGAEITATSLNGASFLSDEDGTFWITIIG